VRAKLQEYSQQFRQMVEQRPWDVAMSTLVLTEHAAMRMAQRSISLKDVELIVLIGTEVEGGYCVREKD
jgi:hypothetical protein